MHAMRDALLLGTAVAFVLQHMAGMHASEPDLLSVASRTSIINRCETHQGPYELVPVCANTTLPMHTVPQIMVKL